jgi:ribosomal-protein-alanine N-acetyltransferase
MSRPEVVLETARLTMRRFALHDAEFILELLNEPSFVRYNGEKGVRTLDDAKNYLKTGPMESYRRHGFGLLLVTRRDDQVPVGMCGLLQRDELDDPDVGFAFLPQFWSMGYGAESTEAILQYGRDRLEMKRIVAITSPENDASIRLLLKAGLSFESTVRLAPDAGDVNLYAVGYE